MSYLYPNRMESHCICVLPGMVKVTCIAFNSDGSRVAVGCSNGKIFIYMVEVLHQLININVECSSLEPLQILSTSEKEIKCISWSHLNPRRIAVGYINEPRIHIYSVTTQQNLSTLAAPEPVRLTLLRRDSNPLFKFSTHSVLHVHHRLIHRSHDKSKSHTSINCEDVVAGCANGNITCWSLPCAAERESGDHSSLDPEWKIRADTVRTKGTSIVSLQHVKNTFDLTGATVSYVVMAAGADGLLSFWEAYPSAVGNRNSRSNSAVKAPQCLRRVDTSLSLVGASVLLYGSLNTHCESCTLRAEMLEKKCRKVRSVEKQRVQTVVTHGVWPDVLVTGKTGELVVYFNLDSSKGNIDYCRRCVSLGMGATSLPATMAIGEPCLSAFSNLKARQEENLLTESSDMMSKVILLPSTHNNLLTYTTQQHLPVQTNDPVTRDTMSPENGNIGGDKSQLLCTREVPNTQFTALAAHPVLPVAVAGVRGKGIVLLDLRHNTKGTADVDTPNSVTRNRPFERVNCSVGMSRMVLNDESGAVRDRPVVPSDENREKPAGCRYWGRKLQTATPRTTNQALINGQKNLVAYSTSELCANKHVFHARSVLNGTPVERQLSQQTKDQSNLLTEMFIAPALVKRGHSEKMDDFVIDSIYKQTKQSNRKKRYRKLFERDEKTRISHHS